MNCRSAESLFSAFVDDELNQNERRFLESHLLSCRRCTASMRELKASMDLCGALPMVDTSPHFEDDVMVMIRSGEAMRPSLIEWLRGLVTLDRIRPFALAGAGASAVLVVGMVMHWGPTERQIADHSSSAPVIQAATPAEVATPDGTELATVTTQAPAPAASAPTAKTDAGYAWADHNVRASSIPDTTVPNPGSRYEDEYITDQFILERGLDGGNNPTVTPVSGRPSDDVYITF